MTKTDYLLSIYLTSYNLLTNTKKKHRKSPKHDDDDDDDVDDVALRHFFPFLSSPFLYLEDLRREHPHCSKDNLVYLTRVTRTTDYRESAELNTDFLRKKEGSSSVCRVMATGGSYQPIRPLNKQQFNVIQRFYTIHTIFSLWTHPF